MTVKDTWESVLHRMNAGRRIKVRIRPATEKYWVVVSMDPFDEGLITTPSESLMRHLAEWATAGNVGYRMSFDMWVFDSEAQMMLFMLKWDGQLSPI